MRNPLRTWFPKYDSRNILVIGWPASGSTFMYQVALELGLRAQRKKHGLRSAESEDFALFAYRDPRDVLCSHARRMNRPLWDSDGPESAIRESMKRFIRKGYREAIYQSATMKNVFMVRYELFCQGNEALFVRFLADNFMIPLTPERLGDILQSTSIQTNIERSRQFSAFDQHDEKTQIHGQHISNRGRSGAWRAHFTQGVEASVKEHLGQLLIDLGYERDLGWTRGDAQQEGSIASPGPQQEEVPQGPHQV